MNDHERAAHNDRDLHEDQREQQEAMMVHSDWWWWWWWQHQHQQIMHHNYHHQHACYPTVEPYDSSVYRTDTHQMMYDGNPSMSVYPHPRDSKMNYASMSLYHHQPKDSMCHHPTIVYLPSPRSNKRRGKKKQWQQQQLTLSSNDSSAGSGGKHKSKYDDDMTLQDIKGERC